MAYTLIETITVGSGGASSIEFTGIPQETGADLVVRLSARQSNQAQRRYCKRKLFSYKSK